MAFVDGDDMLKRDSEVDKTYIGGKAVGKRGRGAENKTILFGMLDRDGDLMVQVVPNAQATTLKLIICENAEDGSTIHSDEWLAYRGISKEGFTHKICNHGDKQYSVDDSHVNTLEGFWGRLKQSIGGTHTHVSK
jgi:transposase-like protein